MRLHQRDSDQTPYRARRAEIVVVVVVVVAVVVVVVVRSGRTVERCRTTVKTIKAC